MGLKTGWGGFFYVVIFKLSVGGGGGAAPPSIYGITILHSMCVSMKPIEDGFIENFHIGMYTGF